MPTENDPSAIPARVHGPRDRVAPRLLAWRDLLANLALMFASVLIVLIFCEGVLFRFIFTPSDVPGNVFMDGLVRLRPGDTGIWRVGDDVAGPYRINAQGWNSGHQTYESSHPAGIYRIAIIGDSFVEGLQVPYDASLAERLERAEKGLQVYRFGISGAPLSQYLAMARHVAQTYHPDRIVLLLVHNDFDESYLAVAGRYTSSFMKLRMRGDEVAGEIQPTPYQPGWRDWLRQTAIMRYLYYRQKLDPSAAVQSIFRRETPPVFQANVAIDTMAKQRAANSNATDYIFGQFKALAGQYNFTPFLIMDGDRRSITAGMDSAPLYREGALWLNAMVSQIAKKHGIDFVDLHPVFEADWRQNHQPLNFVSDNHWNERAHQIAADVLAASLAASR